MNRAVFIPFRLATTILVVSSMTLNAMSFGDEIFRAQGEMTGEVTSSSAIVQTRLTSVDGNTDGDVAGAVGVARFEYADNLRFESSKRTHWVKARADTDYIVKAVLRNLKPGTRYYYRVQFGSSHPNHRRGLYTIEGVFDPYSSAIAPPSNVVALLRLNAVATCCATVASAAN